MLTVIFILSSFHNMIQSLFNRKSLIPRPRVRIKSFSFHFYCNRSLLKPNFSFAFPSHRLTLSGFLNHEERGTRERKMIEEHMNIKGNRAIVKKYTEANA